MTAVQLPSSLYESPLVSVYLSWKFILFDLLFVASQFPFVASYEVEFPPPGEAPDAVIEIWIP